MRTPVIQKNKEAVWVASKEVDLETYAEKAKLTLLSREPAADKIRTSKELKSLYNALYTVSTQQYIIRLIKYIQSGHITTTCFDRKRSSSDQ